MPETKRARFALDWYVVSASSVKMLVWGILALLVIGVGGYWMYLYLQTKVNTTQTIGTQSARFIEITGQVRVKKANATDFTGATEKMPLEAGDTIQTLANSVARVQFIDGASTTIKPDTTLVIKDNELLADKSTKVHVKVRVGTINLATNEQVPGSSNVVQTDVASAKIGGNTEATVGAGDNGQQADIRVTHGDAEIRTQSGETYQATSNERFEIEPTGKLSKRTSMVGIPVLKLPENQQALRLENSGTVRFDWNSVPQARSYVVEIATSSTFEDTIVKSRDGLLAPTAIFDKLSPGSYYWRVRADKAQEQGIYSDPYKFTIVGNSIAQRTLNIKVLRKISMGGGTYLIEGHCDLGARVKVGNIVTRVDSSGNFRAIVSLSQGVREIVVRAEDQDGNVGQQSLRF